MTSTVVFRAAYSYPGHGTNVCLLLWEVNYNLLLLEFTRLFTPSCFVQQTSRKTLRIVAGRRGAGVPDTLIEMGYLYYVL